MEDESDKRKEKRRRRRDRSRWGGEGWKMDERAEAMRERRGEDKGQKREVKERKEKEGNG